MIWVEHDVNTGRILRLSQREIFPTTGAVITFDMAPPIRPADWLVSGGVLVARPVPVVPAREVAGGFVLSGLPDGTVVTVSGPLGGDGDTQAATLAAGQTLSVAIPTPGRYAVTVAPPFPAAERTAEVLVSDGAPPARGDVDLTMAPPMARLIAEALATIDATRAAIQAGIVSAGTGQAMIYLEKRRQAEALAALADDAARDAQAATAFPLVASEAEAGGTTLSAAMRTILAKAAAWSIAARALDTLALSAKRAARAATGPAEARAAAAALTPQTFLARYVADGGDPRDL